MSFYTSLFYYRPGPPPKITGNDLAEFVARIRDTRLLARDFLNDLQLKFGDAIDRNVDASYDPVEIGPCMYRVEDIDWDVELDDSPSLEQMIEALAGDERTIYRASIQLGAPVDTVLEPITRVNSPENTINYYPDSLSFNIEPIACHSLASDESIYVGWLSLSLHGGGYLYPWTFREAIDRALGCPEINQLMEVCRSMWPAPPDKPSARIVELRKTILANLWPYDDFEKPTDWYWGLGESG